MVKLTLEVGIGITQLRVEGMRVDDKSCVLA